MVIKLLIYLYTFETCMFQISFCEAVHMSNALKKKGPNACAKSIYRLSLRCLTWAESFAIFQFSACQMTALRWFIEKIDFIDPEFDIVLLGIICHKDALGHLLPDHS